MASYFPTQVSSTTSGTSVTNTVCYKCQIECATCISPGNVCASCSNGYVLQNGGCVTLQYDNCVVYGSTGCTTCQYGFYLSAGVCYECVNPQANVSIFSMVVCLHQRYHKFDLISMSNIINHYNYYDPSFICACRMYSLSLIFFPSKMSNLRFIGLLMLCALTIAQTTY